MKIEKDSLMIEENRLIETIMKSQNEDGSWGNPDGFYTDKYTGTIWNVLILAQLNASKEDPRIKKACEFILRRSFEPQSGGFSISYSVKYESGLPSQVIPCLTGNMVYALIKLGYLDDSRIQKAIDWIVQYQRVDDGTYNSILDTKYEHLSACFSKHSCFMGVTKSLKALAEVPKDRRTKKINDKIAKLVEFLLIHHIFKKSSDTNTISKPGWTKFGFPLMYQTDVLEIMDIFRKLEIRDERLNEALDLIQSKQVEGEWLLESTMNSKMLMTIGEKKKPCEFLTKQALDILKFYGRI